MEFKKVSIIIPVYNNERFLDKCLTSVLNQTLNDVEIIIINDGSTDGSYTKLQEYEQSHSNIILLNQPNAGQAAAINRGLDVAQGEYIGFVDADDYIELDMFENLYKEAEENQLDLVICNWDRVNQDGALISYHDHSQVDGKILNRNEVIREFFLNKDELVEGFSWNKLIKRNLFTEYNIRYFNIRYEDIPTIFKILTKVNRCKYINRKFYHYVQHESQITHTKSERNVRGFIEAIEIIHDILIEENLYSQFKDDYFIYRSGCFFAEYTAYCGANVHSKELSQIFNKVLKPITIKKCITLNKSMDFKLLIKVVLYKLGLLKLSIGIYHKWKLI